MSEPIAIESGPDPNAPRYRVTLDGVVQLLTVAELLAATVPPTRPAPPLLPPARAACALAGLLSVAAECQRGMIGRLADRSAATPRTITVEDVLARRQQILDEC